MGVKAINNKITTEMTLNHKIFLTWPLNHSIQLLEKLPSLFRYASNSEARLAGYSYFPWFEHESFLGVEKTRMWEL